MNRQERVLRAQAQAGGTDRIACCKEHYPSNCFDIAQLLMTFGYAAMVGMPTVKGLYVVVSALREDDASSVFQFLEFEGRAIICSLLSAGRAHFNGLNLIGQGRVNGAIKQ